MGDREKHAERVILNFLSEQGKRPDQVDMMEVKQFAKYMAGSSRGFLQERDLRAKFDLDSGKDALRKITG